MVLLLIFGQEHPVSGDDLVFERICENLKQGIK